MALDDPDAPLFEFAGPPTDEADVPWKLSGFGGGAEDCRPRPLFDKDGKPVMVGPGHPKSDATGKQVPLVDEDGKPLSAHKQL